MWLNKNIRRLSKLAWWGLRKGARVLTIALGARVVSNARGNTRCEVLAARESQACPKALPPLRRGGWGGRPEVALAAQSAIARPRAHVLLLDSMRCRSANDKELAPFSSALSQRQSANGVQANGDCHENCWDTEEAYATSRKSELARAAATKNLSLKPARVPRG